MSKVTQLTSPLRPGNEKGRWTRCRSLPAFAGIVVAMGLSATTALSQGVAYTGRSAGEGATATTPITASVRAEERTKKITIVGYNDEGVLFTESDTGEGTRLVLKLDKIESVDFFLDYDPADVMSAVSDRNWYKAIRILKAVITPTLPYLNLPDNNAAELALDLGGYMMRAVEQQARLAKDPSEADEEMVEKMYTAAYTVFKYVAAADWSYVAKIAKIKRIKCLLELKKPKTAAKLFAQIEEPFIGDAAYGLYWLIKAELELTARDFRAAMDATVKSICFENKDIDTFPDALFISAICYEELQNWHRARDVYYEIARIFPKTDWQAMALRRLTFIRKEGLTNEEEKTPIENVFFGLKEDMNQLVDDLLEEEEAKKKSVPVAKKPEEAEIDLKTAE